MSNRNNDGAALVRHNAINDAIITYTNSTVAFQGILKRLPKTNRVNC